MTTRRAFVFVSCAAIAYACSTFEASSTDPPQADAATDAPPTPPGPPEDAGDASLPTPCDPSKPFTILAESIPGLDGTNIAGITLTPDELIAVTFVFDDAGAYSLVESRRKKTTDPFVTSRTLGELDAAERAAIAPDGLSIYFSGVVDGGDSLFVSHRTSLDTTFDAPQRLSDLDRDVSNDGPYLAAGALWYSAGTPGNFRVWRASLVDGSVGTPALVAGLERPGIKMSFVYPVVAENGLAIYWSGSPNVWRAVRDVETDPFSHVFPVAEIDVGGQFEQASWLSRDRCRLYYVRGSNGVSRALVARH